MLRSIGSQRFGHNWVTEQEHRVCVWSVYSNLAHFLLPFVLFLKLWEFFSSLRILDMSFFECMYWRYFLLICGLCFHFLSGSFVSSESFDFIKFQLISFYGWGYGLSTKFWPALKPQKIPMFSSRSFISLDFTLGLWPTLSLFLCTVWVVSKVLFFFSLSISISRCPSST